MSETPPLRPTGLATHVGLVREHNEDAALAVGPVWVVCDGMGGHAAGEVASALTVEAVAALADGPVTPEGVDDAVQAANAAVLAHGSHHPESAGLGTTCVVLALCDSGSIGAQWVVANVGDSRAYVLAEGRLSQLTTDHSEVQELVDLGVITRHDAHRHPLRHLITRAIGLGPGVRPDLVARPVVPGERYLLCTDGLTGELDEGTIARMLQHYRDPQECADALVRAACEAGGRDNVTVVVVDAG